MSNNNKWDTNDIGDQSGRVAIVTGSSSGIGLEAARVLAEKNASVILAVRNLEKGNNVAGQITKQHNNASVNVMELDLASLASVSKFTEKFKSEYNRLDLLINNAGVMMPPYSKTTDGFELQFGTNHLGHFALTGLVIDRIKTTPDSRIVNVSSVAHRQGKINFDDLNWENRKYKPMKSYGDSKIANIYFSYNLGKRLSKIGGNPIVTMAHPGWTATELQRHSGVMNFFNQFFAQDSSMGALPTLYAALAPDVKTGDYFGPSGIAEIKGYPKKVKTNGLSKNTDISDRLWDVSEKLTGVKFAL